MNDPSTAINSIDHLSRLLIRFASRQEPAPVTYDLPGDVRVILPWITFDGLLDSAFEQIRHYASSDIAVSLRLLRALADIAVTCDDQERRRLLGVLGKRVMDGCTMSQLNNDLTNLLKRMAFLDVLVQNRGG